MATIRYCGSRVCKGLFSSDECDLEMFPSEPAQDMTSLTFGIDMVLHIPDGAEGFLQVWCAGDFQLLPAPMKRSHKCLSEDLKLTRQQYCQLHRTLLFPTQRPCSFQPLTFLFHDYPRSSLAYHMHRLETENQRVITGQRHNCSTITTCKPPQKLWSAGLHKVLDAFSLSIHHKEKANKR